MAVTVRQNANGTTAAATTFTTITPAFPAASVSGNIVLLVVVSDATVVTPSGWALDRSQVNSDGHYHFRRTSAGETTYSAVTITSATCWWVLELAGCTASPLDGVISAGTTSAATSQSTGTTLTLTQTDELAVASWGSSVGSGGSFIASTFSAQTNGYAEIGTDIVTSRASATNVGLSLAIKSGPVGATETSTATASATAGTTAVLTTYRATAVTVTPRAIRPVRILQAMNRAGSF